ncbi:MAG TPA: 30S ribosomal protein S20 [Planctomycetota bacterium]|nr:30S ribosomal protein S20 [Planctomycetota bacterium]
MAHSVSAWKSARKNEKNRLRNKAVRSEIKTWSKKLADAVASNDTALARQYFVTATKKLDKSAKVNVYHKNTVNRKKSSLARLMNKLAAGGAGKADAAAPAPTA